MATITILKENTYEGKVTGHSVTLADGTTGYLDDKGSTKGLRVGDSVNYTTAVKQNKKGGNYNLLTLTLATATNAGSSTPANPQQPIKASVISTPQNSSIEVQKAHAAVSAMEFIVNAVVVGKLDWPQLAEKQREATQILWNEIDEIYNNGKK
jgi:hypothetical protein